MAGRAALSPDRQAFARAQRRARADGLAEVDLAAVLACLRQGLTAERVRQAWAASLGPDLARSMADHIRDTIRRALEILKAAFAPPRGKTSPRPTPPAPRR